MRRSGWQVEEERVKENKDGFVIRIETGLSSDQMEETLRGPA